MGLSSAYLNEAFPRRVGAFLLASKWGGGKGSEVLYSGPFADSGIYKQNASAVIVIGDQCYVSLGIRVGVDDKSTFPGELAPMRYCKLIKRENRPAGGDDTYK